MADRARRWINRTPLHHLAASSLLGAILMGIFPVTLHAAQGGKTEVLPMQKAAPAVVFLETTGQEADLRRELRSKNRANELGASASQVLFSQAPTGSFGFIAPHFLGMALVTQSPDLTLKRVASAPNAYEVHKLADGSGMLVGFVGSDLMAQLRSSHRPKTIRLALHSNPSDQAAHIIAVPLVKLAADRMPTRLDPKNPDGPVIFEMDLQSSTSRPSTHGGQ
ncbi:MAG: exported protein of unknown function [Nitrospira sp.]|nr:exported protein of unknown function [Nitrospira sp.]